MKVDALRQFEKRIENLERSNLIKEKHSLNALSFVHSTIKYFLAVLAIVGFVIALLGWKTMSDIKEDAAERVQQVTAEVIFTNYKKEADLIIEGLKTEIINYRRNENLNNLRSYYLQNGKDEKALVVGKQIIDEYPNDAWSYYNQANYYALLYDKSDKEQIIRDLLEQAFDIDADALRPYFIDSYSFTIYKDRNWFKNLSTK